ncbi:hypothetical protein N1851_017226 [Merluccius polli]|uniref:Uncharacterized protein n=1 Tax=Merluccius polli TaxID=89951 RepID=A0AA47NZ86_MERPO|nr:hypothetical protein N1851_017226 [Merluccius polli]
MKLAMLSQANIIQYSWMRATMQVCEITIRSAMQEHLDKATKGLGKYTIDVSALHQLTTDTTTHAQLIVVYCYIDTANTVQERDFFAQWMEPRLLSQSKVLLEQLNVICSPDKETDI